MANVVNEYEHPAATGVSPEIEETSTDPVPISLPSRRQLTSSTTPLLGTVPPHSKEPGGDEGAPLAEPELKRPRLDEDEKDDMVLDLNMAIQEIDYGYLMEIELDFSSERQKKSFKRNAQAFLVKKKMSSAEVNYKKLSEADKVLFRNAKASEVSSFLRTEAVRCCLSVEWTRRTKRDKAREF